MAPPLITTTSALPSLMRILFSAAAPSLGAQQSVETDQHLQELALDVFGAYGPILSGTHAIEGGGRPRAYLYSRSETIMGGTSEIQRNLIAQRLLGLPR